MKADTQIRQQIFRKIRRIPSEKLNDLNDYLSKLVINLQKPFRLLVVGIILMNLHSKILLRI
jgi:hypothetical protein